MTEVESADARTARQTKEVLRNVDDPSAYARATLTRLVAIAVLSLMGDEKPCDATS